ncbi:MAG: hypothetical protein KDB01_27635, partial [Planctomycetaceae bacterium]|nr:hypothetical protein [Planctomycetaceae bacterium]
RHEIQLQNAPFELGSRFTFEKLVRIRGPLVFSPDSKYAAASTKSREYMGAFFDTESGKILHLLDPDSAQATNRGHEYGCNFAFTRDGKQIVSTDHNGRVAVWEFPSGELVGELDEFHVEANHDPPELAVTLDNRVIVAGDYADSRIRILSLNANE